MSTTPEDVKRNPRHWEHVLLTIARADGGQAAVDATAKAIAGYRDRTRHRLKRIQAASSFHERQFLYMEIENDRHDLITLTADDMLKAHSKEGDDE